MCFFSLTIKFSFILSVIPLRKYSNFEAFQYSVTHILALLQVWISSMVLQFCGSVSKSKSSPEVLCLKQSGVCCLLKQSIFSPDKNVHPLFLWAASLFKFALFLTATPFRTIKSGNFFRYLRFQLLWNDKKR